MRSSLREQIGRDEFDYQVLMDALSNYVAPRARVTALLRSGEIIRIKKGLYVFGEGYRREPLCRELLANLICGPSFISLDSALAYYGLIPERVDAITSVTPGKARRFETPLGLFIYRQTPCFSIGYDRIAQGERSFLLAQPERALADKIRDDRVGGLRTRKEMEAYLFENLRMEPDAVRTFDAELLEALAAGMKSHKIHVCASLIRVMRRKS